MKDAKADAREHNIEQEYDLDAPPEKVWRAISIAEFRENWLPKAALADPDAVAVIPGQTVRYRLREEGPPFLESTVTFTIAPNAAGGTSLRIVHELIGAPSARSGRTAANANAFSLLRAA